MDRDEADDKIDELAAHITHQVLYPPKSYGGWERIERIIGWISFVLTIALVVSVCTLAVKAVNTSFCINTNLGSRNVPAVNDADAHIAYAQAAVLQSATQAAADAAGAKFFTDLSVDPNNKTLVQADFADYTAKFNSSAASSAAFLVASQTYEKTLASDAALRAAKPLGEC